MNTSGLFVPLGVETSTGSTGEIESLEEWFRILKNRAIKWYMYQFLFTLNK